MNIISNFAYPIICINKKNLIHTEIYLKKIILKLDQLLGEVWLNNLFKKYIISNYECLNAKAHQLGFYIPNRPDLNLRKLIC